MCLGESIDGHPFDERSLTSSTDKTDCLPKVCWILNATPVWQGFEPTIVIEGQNPFLRTLLEQDPPGFLPGLLVATRAQMCLTRRSRSC